MPTRTLEAEGLIDVPAVAEILGVGRQTVYRLVWDGELPAVKISAKALRFVEAEVEAFAKTWNAPGWIQTEEVARRLGVGVRTVQRLAEAGDLPSERRRGVLRFREADVERFVSDRRTR
jgi:excisionase family DNA binding protein